MTPDEFTIAETYVDVGDGHQLYVQDWGNVKAQTPIFFLHGGPGNGQKKRYKQRFNPFEQRVIFFDQRGAGRSVPYGELENNTTTELIEDISRVADHLHIDKFRLTGGSWGACLALAYALKHPERVVEMALQGVFTASQAEIDYFDKGNYRTFFPDVWEQYLNNTPRSHQSDPTAYHFGRILGSNRSAAQQSAYIYASMEKSLLYLDDRFESEDSTKFDHMPTRIEVYYMANRCFLPDRYILDNVHKLGMPIWIVQGRYDFICPPAAAYELHRQVPNNTLIWTMAGHGNDRSNYDVLRAIRAHWI